ncbi:MAG: NAD(P)-binding protein, partial [Bryobacteraceae bacterium]
MGGPLKKVAILGGGVGALTTAFEITSQPDWQSQYEITVYQMGWRLGGKGASGRNRNLHDRIQEHGLHLWMGFYENAFDMIRRAYAYCDENNLTPETPFRTYKEAFSPMNFTAVTEQYSAGAWNIWPIFWPPNDEMPGDPSSADVPRPFDFSTPWGYVVALIAWVRSEVDRATRDHDLLHGILANLCDDLLAFTEHSSDAPANDSLIHRIERFALRLGTDPRDHSDDDRRRLISGMACFQNQIVGTLEAILDKDDEIRHLLITADTGIAIARGMIADDVIRSGFTSIDQYDFIEWLGRHGCRNAASPLTISMYDACFGYASGDANQKNMAAGSTLYGALRLMFTYRGALMWWMEAGMGDTIFTPIYKALQHRGVKFEFFHKITHLTPSADGTSVST